MNELRWLLIANCANSDQISKFSPFYSPFDFNRQCNGLIPTDPSVMIDFFLGGENWIVTQGCLQ